MISECVSCLIIELVVGVAAVVLIINCIWFVVVMCCVSIRVIPCQINRFLAIFPLTSSDSFEIWHTCRNCLETNIRQIF